MTGEHDTDVTEEHADAGTEASDRPAALEVAETLPEAGGASGSGADPEGERGDAPGAAADGGAGGDEREGGTR